MTGLSDRDRRALGIGLTIVLIAFGLVRGVPLTLALLASSQEALRLDQRAVSAARALVAANPAMRDSLAARNRRLAQSAAALIAASDPTSAASTLGAFVTGAAEDVNVRVSTLHLRPDSTARGGFLRPRVTVEARGDISGLMQLLLLLEGGTPLLAVTDLTITQPDPAGAGRAEELAIRIVVEALARIDSAAARSAQ